MERSAARWWQDAVIYQVYPRSFADSNGDGHGDLPGLIERLDHLRWLGVDALWLTPVFPSPNRDWGYDVSDYLSIHEDFGTLEDSDRLVAEASARGMRVIYDLVPNHTSDRHPWFLDACTGRDASHRDWYVWADPRPDGSLPNNWTSVAGGPAWTLHEPTGQYYLHNFLPSQPDLNWWNPDVGDAFEDILTFWFERGIAGFRIDVAHGLVKDRELRDNPLPGEDDPEPFHRRGQVPVYNMNRPETHEIFRRWRRLADASDRVLIGETWVLQVGRMLSYYGTAGDELHLPLNFPFVLAELSSEALAAIVDEVESGLPEGSWPVWFGSNHDISRFPTRWCRNDEDRVRCALMMLLTLRGTPILYYGDEIGQIDVPVPDDRIRDTMGMPGSINYPGRDPSRTPMQWEPRLGAGFTAPEVEPWLPYGDVARINVADQRRDAASVLNLTRDLIALRRARTELRRGGYERLEAPAGVWLYRRGVDTVIALNLSSRSADVRVGDARVLLSTRRDRDGERCARSLTLRAHEGVVLGCER